MESSNRDNLKRVQHVYWWYLLPANIVTLLLAHVTKEGTLHHNVISVALWVVLVFVIANVSLQMYYLYKYWREGRGR